MHRILAFWILFCKIVLNLVFCLIPAVIFLFFSNESKIKYRVLHRKKRKEQCNAVKRWTMKRDAVLSKSGCFICPKPWLYLLLSLYPEPYPLISMIQFGDSTLRTAFQTDTAATVSTPWKLMDKKYQVSPAWISHTWTVFQSLQPFSKNNVPVIPN